LKYCFAQFSECEERYSSGAPSDCICQLLPASEVNLINIFAPDVSAVLTHNIILRLQENCLLLFPELPDTWWRPREINLRIERIILGAVKSQWDSSFKTTAANPTKATNNWEN
jgi:hypothetical protein